MSRITFIAQLEKDIPENLIGDIPKVSEWAKQHDHAATMELDGFMAIEMPLYERVKPTVRMSGGKFGGFVWQGEYTRRA